jgi:FKBP-type peptidyl-prolyl cis-trans isomerase
MRILTFFVLIMLASCGNGDTEKAPEVEWNTEKSTDLNKNLAIEEEIEIKLFLEQHKDWEMTKTGTGLRYFIYHNGDGDSAQVGQIAQVEMKITLLDGTECYKTGKDEIEEFMIDKSQVESGIHEGIKKMREGDKAKLIMPSHLGHGLIGDFDKIPPLAVLVADIHLIKLVK